MALIAAAVTSDCIAVMTDASSTLPGGRINERFAVKGAEMNSVKIMLAPMSSTSGRGEGDSEGKGNDDDDDNDDDNDDTDIKIGE